VSKITVFGQEHARVEGEKGEPFGATVVVQLVRGNYMRKSNVKWVIRHR
jgi:hypothetical protein